MAVPPGPGSPPERDLKSIVDKEIDLDGGKRLTFPKDTSAFMEEYNKDQKVSFVVKDGDTTRNLYISFPPELSILAKLTNPQEIKAAILPLLLSIPKIEDVFNGTIKKIQGHMEGGQFKSFKSFNTEGESKEGEEITEDSEYKKRFSYLNKIMKHEIETSEDKLPDYVKRIYETAKRAHDIGVGAL